LHRESLPELPDFSILLESSYVFVKDYSLCEANVMTVAKHRHLN